MANRLTSVPTNEPGNLMSWLYRYEGGNKIPVSGYAALDTNYKRISSPSGSSFTTRSVGTGASTVFYNIGAPRFTSVTLRSDF